MSGPLADSFKTPRLTPGESHLWLASLRQPRSLVDSLAGCLNQYERETAARFHGEDNQRRYLVSHGLLRVLLGRYLERPPASLGFGIGRFGKPYLQLPEGSAAVQFNLSHAHDLAALAVSSVAPVGVDVERLRSTTDIPKLVKRYFSKTEIAHFQLIAFEQHPQWFFRVWTCKEAVSKAMGCGLSQPLNRFTVPEADLEARFQVTASCDLIDIDTWSVTGFRYGADYLGAVATPATRQRQISTWQLTPDDNGLLAATVAATAPGGIE